MSQPEEGREELFRLLAETEDAEALTEALVRRIVAEAEEREPEWGALLRAAAIPRRLDAAVVGVLRDAPDDEAGNRAAMARLADLSFVLPDPEGKSYALHEQVRALLLEEWPAAGRRPRYEALSRALEAHFQERDPLEALYHRFVFDPGGAFAAFERRFQEADQFYRRAECGALTLAAEAQAREMDEAQRRWLRYYRARLALVLDRWAEAEEGYRSLLAELPPSPRPAATPLPEGEGSGPVLSKVEGERGKLRTWTLHDLGMALRAQGKWEAALQAYRGTLEGWRALGDRWNEGTTLNNMGIVYRAQGRWASALEVYEGSLEIKRELGDRHGEEQTLGNMGNIYQSQGRWAEALKVYERSLAFCRQVGDRHGEGATLNNMGETYIRMGQWAEAKTHFDQSLPIRYEIGDRLGESYVLHNLGEWHQKQGQLEEAIARYEEALRLRQKLAAWPEAGKTLHALAEVYALRGEWQPAAEAARQAAEAWEKVRPARLKAMSPELPGGLE